MTGQAVRVPAEWLELREPADAAARSPELADRVARDLAATERLVVHDLGAGTGAMGRWLAPRLPRPQHWVLHDWDTHLLERALAGPPGGATVEARPSDLTRLTPGDLAGATLITGSALLDMLTAHELTRMLDACIAVGTPVLLTLTVTGRVTLTPTEPFDARVDDAFNAHQRRARLGPGAVAAAVAWCRSAGAEVHVRPSPWRLGAAHDDLVYAWLDGWIAAACEQDSALSGEAVAYRDRRLAQLAAGELAVTVDHADLLVRP